MLLFLVQDPISWSVYFLPSWIIIYLVNKYMSCVIAVYVVSTDRRPDSRLWPTFCPEMTLLSLASTRNLWSNIWSSKVGLTVDSVVPLYQQRRELSACSAVEGCFSREGSTFNVSVTGMHLDLWVDGTLNTFPSVLCNFLGILTLEL